MATHGEELSRLRAEHTSLLQLMAVKDQLLASKDAQLSTVIACKDEVIASKDELLASRAAELQRCMALLQHSTLIPTSAATPDSSKPLHVNASSSALDRDDILDDVFSFVGAGDHLYVGGVSRRWRGRYMQYCESNMNRYFESIGKLATRQCSAVMTSSRLQLALSSGLATKWDFETDKGQLYVSWICEDSLEPEKVMTLLRLHGVPWSTELCSTAARSNKLALLQWLHSHACPWIEDHVRHYASMKGSVAMLEWLWTVAPWPCELWQPMLEKAAINSNLSVAKWIKGYGTAWPAAYTLMANYADCSRRCWSVSAVQWALACGAGWLDWKCTDYDADEYNGVKLKKQATELLEWAHANGCPCTCGHVERQPE
jgi:hypothetical protein